MTVLLVNRLEMVVSLEDTYSNIICQILSTFTNLTGSYLLVEADVRQGTAGSLV
jgi:hypothetical protein